MHIQIIGAKRPSARTNLTGDTKRIKWDPQKWQKKMELNARQKEIDIKNTQDTNGETPLFTAILHPFIIDRRPDEFDSFKDCLEKYDINHQNNLGQTALYIACKKAKGLRQEYSQLNSLYKVQEYIKELLANGANVNICCNEGITPLHIAAKNSCHVLAEELLKKGAEVDPTIKHTITPLHIAAKNRCPELVKLLLEHGANPLINPRTINNPLYLACCDGMPDPNDSDSDIAPLLVRSIPKYEQITWQDTKVVEELLRPHKTRTTDELVTHYELITQDIYDRFLFSGQFFYGAGIGNIQTRMLSPNFMRLWQSITQSGKVELLDLSNDREHIDVQKFKKATRWYTEFEWAIFHNDQPSITKFLHSDTLRDPDTRQEFFSRHQNLYNYLNEEEPGLLDDIYPDAKSFEILETDTLSIKFKKAVSAIARIRNQAFVETGLKLQYIHGYPNPFDIPKQEIPEADIDKIAKLLYFGTQKWTKELAEELKENGLYSSIFPKEIRETLSTRTALLNPKEPTLKITKDTRLTIPRDCWTHIFTFLLPEEKYSPLY